MIRTTHVNIRVSVQRAFVTVLLLFVSVFMMQQANAQTSTEEWQAITDLEIIKGSRVYDTANRVYYTFNKINNNSGKTISGPIRLVVKNSSYPVVNANGTDANGKPYFDALVSGETSVNGSTAVNIRINFQSTRAAFTYTLEAQKKVDQLDTDKDGIFDSNDSCPLDPKNDEDHDELCGNVDNCPLDPKNDEDGDGQCGNIDQCPLDPQNDVDGDGLCANVDSCPTISGDSCISINGQVLGNGAALNGASIEIGDKTTGTDSTGKFSISGLGTQQSAHDNSIDFYPVKIKAQGYASGFAKVAIEPGKTGYEVTVNLQPVSESFNLNSNQLDQGVNVEINKGGAAVGQLIIPKASLPPEVTELTGNITYLDPETDEIQSSPGGDLLALPADADPNTTIPVPLESFGMMEFDLKDQNGQPIHVLPNNAEVCMKATSGLNTGDVVPLWYYDELVGLWKEEGQGTVTNKNGQLEICGNVKHFTWWNYDQPIDTHACFKFDFRDEATGKRLAGSIQWQTEGVTYNGTTPNRACNIDGNDPNVGETIDSFTVKRSTATIEKIRVLTYIGGGKFYLKRDGDGTYSLTQNQANATVFDTPRTIGSCLNNVDVQNCAFLDYLDGANADGILPLSSDINLPPLISNFNVVQGNLLTGATTGVSATATDPEGTQVKMSWTSACLGATSVNTGSISPSNQGPLASPALFNTTFTAPNVLQSPIGRCLITATATDSDGVSSHAEKLVYVTGSFNYSIKGILYGTNGEPLPNISVEYDNTSCPNAGQQVATDAEGRYNLQFNTKTCVVNGDSQFDLGSLKVMYTYDNMQRAHFVNVSSLLISVSNCSVQTDQATQCLFDIRLPTVWSSLTGKLYPKSGDNFKNLKIMLFGASYPVGSDVTEFNLAQGTVSYGPVLVPVAATGSLFGNTNLNEFYAGGITIPSVEVQSQDIGEGSASVTAKLFNDQGIVIPGLPVSLGSTTSSSTVQGTSDQQGEFTTSLPLGSVHGRVNSGNYNFARVGYVRAPDQPVFLDFKSPDSCTVTGTAYDSKGLPLGAGVTINAFSEGNLNSQNNSNGVFNTVTDSNGRYVFNNIRAGVFSLMTDQVGSFSARSYFIDNCRPENGNKKIVRFDRPFFSQ